MIDLLPSSTGRSGNIQQWMAPATSKYRITVAGAAGGHGNKPIWRRGRGAIISGDFYLSEGEVVDFLVGQAPINNLLIAGGGGGTFAVRAPADTSYIMYVYRHGLRPLDRGIMESLMLACGAPIRAVSEAEFRAWDAWDDVALLVMGYPASDGTTYASPSSPTRLSYANMPFPVVSFCRHTSRNHLGMSASNSSGVATATLLNKTEGAPQLGWNVEESVPLFGQTNAQIITNDTAGQIIYSAENSYSGGSAAIVYQEQNGYPRVHWGVYRLLENEALLEMLRNLIGVRPDQYQPLIIAGGGGGTSVGDNSFEDGYAADASLTENGKAGIAEGSASRAGAGGMNGMGGHYDGIDRVHGGGGFYGFGVSGFQSSTSSEGAGEFAGFPYMAGGFGGNWYSNNEGGYGGGGSVSLTTGWGAACGGGGYSGGGGAYAISEPEGASGGGGGSFNAGDSPRHVGWNDGAGWVLIQQLYTVGNRARAASGGAVDEVIIREWVSKDLVVRSVPNEHGDWVADLLEGLYEVHYYHSESQPAIHGPYTVGK